MKKSFLLLLLFAFGLHLLFAQAPEMIKYQTVVRNSSGEVIKNQNVGFRISILQSGPDGVAVYTETHAGMTNDFGLVNLEIGSGAVDSGLFSEIEWGNDNYFIKIEFDGGNSGSFAEMGTSQLLSVPYAFYAKHSGNGLTLSGAAKPGDILYHDGASWVNLSKGINGQTLRLDEGIPGWAEPGFALPLVTTLPAFEIMVDSALSGGNIISSGFTEITAKGVCWSINQNPTVSDSITNDGSEIGNFTSELKGLLPNTTYYVRAYATNGAGTAYGNQVTFKTFQTVVFPTVTTSGAVNITEFSALSGGNVTATGGAEVIAKGICWSTNQNPTVADMKTDEGTGTGQFNSQMDDLDPGTIYYVRAYATNSAGAGYGSQVTLTTNKTPPKIVTKDVTSISPMGGVSGGTIILTGGGTISDKGICWSETENPTINDNTVSAGTGSDAFNSAIGLLKPNTTCYVRAYAVNEIGTAYGDQKSFTTEDAFYDGFETGFSGTTGGWGIVMGDAVEGAYSLSTNKSNSEASLIRTLTNSGQINFYVKVNSSGVNVTFYIDDIEQGSYSNTFWGLQSYPVTEGEHTFKWKFIYVNYTKVYAWIDFIVMPK